MSNLDTALGEKIKFYRKKSRLTQKQLAEAVNLSDKFISDVETGKSFPQLMNLFLIADALNVTLDDLTSDYILKNNKYRSSASLELNQLFDEMALSDENVLIKFNKILDIYIKIKSKYNN